MRDLNVKSTSMQIAGRLRLVVGGWKNTVPEAEKDALAFIMYYNSKIDRGEVNLSNFAGLMSEFFRGVKYHRDTYAAISAYLMYFDVGELANNEGG